MFSFPSCSPLFIFTLLPLNSPNPQSLLLQYKHIIKIYMYSCDARILLSSPPYSRCVVKITLVSPFLICKQIAFYFFHFLSHHPHHPHHHRQIRRRDTSIQSHTFMHSPEDITERELPSLSPIDTCFVASEITKIVAPFVMSLCRERRDREKA